MATIIDGKAVSAFLKDGIKKECLELKVLLHLLAHELQLSLGGSAPDRTAGAELGSHVRPYHACLLYTSILTAKLELDSRQDGDDNGQHNAHCVAVTIAVELECSVVDIVPVSYTHLFSAWVRKCPSSPPRPRAPSSRRPPVRMPPPTPVPSVTPMTSV